MSYGVHAIATPALAAGLRLAGIPTDDAVSASSAADQVTTQLDVPDLGILLIEQPLFDGLPAGVRREIESRALPIVVPVPEPQWEATTDRAQQYILELLRRAIGYRVKLQ